MRLSLSRSLCVLAFAAVLSPGLSAQTDFVLTFLLDRSGSMAGSYGGTAPGSLPTAPCPPLAAGASRCEASIAFAKCEAREQLNSLINVLGPVVMTGTVHTRVYIFQGGTVMPVAPWRAISSYSTGTPSVTEMDLDLSAISCFGTTPLAQGLEFVRNDVVANFPGIPGGQRSMYLYSDGGENSSAEGTFGLPGPGAPAGARFSHYDATSGTQCGTFGAPVDPLGLGLVGTWQQAACAALDGVIFLPRYFSSITDGLDDSTFLRALARSTGGSYVDIPPQGATSLFSRNQTGVGGLDRNGRRLRLQHEGTPRLGDTVRISLFGSRGGLYRLAVGSSDRVVSGVGPGSAFGRGTALPFSLGTFGIRGQALQTSFENEVGPFVVGARGATLTVPSFPFFLGLELHLQAYQIDGQVPGGVVTSDALGLEVIR